MSAATDTSAWPVWEIINPSDALTMLAPTFEVGAAAVIVLGHGKYGLESQDGDQKTPVLLGWDGFIADTYPGEEGLVEFLRQHHDEVVAALASVALGSFDDRADFDDAVSRMEEPHRSEFIAARNDRRRSSLNDIEGRAHQLAKAMHAARPIES